MWPRADYGVWAFWDGGWRVLLACLVFQTGEGVQQRENLRPAIFSHERSIFLIAFNTSLCCFPEISAISSELIVSCFINSSINMIFEHWTMRTQKRRTATLCSMPHVAGTHTPLQRMQGAIRQRHIFFPKVTSINKALPQKFLWKSLRLCHMIIEHCKVKAFAWNNKIFLRENFYKNHLSVIGVGTTIQNWIVANLAPAAVYLTNPKLDALAWVCVCVCVYA